MKYFIDEHQINSGIQILKRQVVFGPSSNNPVANLHTDTQADAKIIKIINNKQVNTVYLNIQMIYFHFCIRRFQSKR